MIRLILLKKTITNCSKCSILFSVMLSCEKLRKKAFNDLMFRSAKKPFSFAMCWVNLDVTFWKKSEKSMAHSHSSWTKFSSGFNWLPDFVFQKFGFIIALRQSVCKRSAFRIFCITFLHSYIPQMSCFSSATSKRSGWDCLPLTKRYWCHGFFLITSAYQPNQRTKFASAERSELST